jgi:hypothetical protein
VFHPAVIQRPVAHLGRHPGFDNYWRSLTERIIGSLNSAAKRETFSCPCLKIAFFASSFFVKNIGETEYPRPVW